MPFKSSPDMPPSMPLSHIATPGRFPCPTLTVEADLAIETPTIKQFNNFGVIANMVERLEANESKVTKYLNERDFEEVLFRELARRISDETQVP